MEGGVILLSSPVENHLQYQNIFHQDVYLPGPLILITLLRLANLPDPIINDLSTLHDIAISMCLISKSLTNFTWQILCFANF
jgi:hypothetical protein